MLVTLRVRTELKQDTTEDCKVHKVAKQFFFFFFLRNKMLHQQNNVVYESKFYKRKKEMYGSGACKIHNTIKGESWCQDNSYTVIKFSHVIFA